MIALQPCIALLFSKSYKGPDPVVQQLGSEIILGKDGHKRMRLCLSDGYLWTNMVFLSAAATYKISEGYINNEPLMLLKLSKFWTRILDQKRILFVDDLSLAYPEDTIRKFVGNPAQLVFCPCKSMIGDCGTTGYLGQTMGHFTKDSAMMDLMFLPLKI